LSLAVRLRFEAAPTLCAAPHGFCDRHHSWSGFDVHHRLPQFRHSPRPVAAVELDVI
jgi:hypothetical protein